MLPVFPQKRQSAHPEGGTLAGDDAKERRQGGHHGVYLHVQVVRPHLRS